jgi:hypothetical protein
MAVDLDVPPFFSQRRASFLAGKARGTIAQKIEAGVLGLHGPHRQISRAELEEMAGRRFTRDDWDRATVAINRAGMREMEAA